jgi:outer membrane protein TolC
MMGIDSPGKPVNPSGELIFAPAEIPKVDLSLEKAFKCRSDYLAARAGLEALARNLDVARTGWTGDVALSGSYGGRWAASPTDEPDGLSNFEDSGRIGLVFTVPLFDGGQIDGRIKEERSKLFTAQERLRRMELLVQLDVETSILNTESAARRIGATSKAVEQGVESLRIQKEKYSLGRGAIIDVLDAQSALLDVQTNYYRALEAYSVAWAQYKLAIGEQLN